MPKKNQSRVTQSKRSRKSKPGANVVSGSGTPSTIVASISRPLMPIKTTRLVNYHETVAFSQSGGSMATYVFSTNGLFDPNVTSTGHQPAGFDQAMLFYEHYYVTRSEIEATFHNMSATIYPIIALSVNGSSTPITSLNQLIENGSCVRGQLGLTSSPNGILTLKASCDVGKFGGIKNMADSSEYQGNVSSNPAEASYYHISGIDMEALGTTNLTVEVNMRFIAHFIEPRDISLSLQSQIDSLIRADARRRVVERKTA